MNMNLIRRKNFFDIKYWITTNSFSFSNGKWGNCLYLHFAKEDFPNLVYPKLVETDYKWQKKRFEYEQSDFENLDWHGGCTFYEETINVAIGKTYVKVGCDYSHYMDDYYMYRDCGKEILEVDGERLAKNFYDLVKMREHRVMMLLFMHEIAKDLNEETK